VSIKFPARISATGELCAPPEDADILAQPVRTDSQHGPGTPLATTAMARDYYDRISVSLNPKHSA